MHDVGLSNNKGIKNMKKVSEILIGFIENNQCLNDITSSEL